MAIGIMSQPDKTIAKRILKGKNKTNLKIPLHLFSVVISGTPKVTKMGNICNIHK
jgi:hypothetical protein